MSPSSTAKAARIRLLFLAANPDSTTPLHAGREVRRIRDRLAVTEHRSAVEIVERWAVRPADLQQALIETRPHIVHFSGHGTTEYELMLEGDDGSPRPISARVLTELFRLRGDGVRMVVLSACHSVPQAEAIAEHVDAAIGMRRAIGSEAASEFSAALYHAIGSGDSIRGAFDSARLHLEAAGIAEHHTPQLLVRRDGADVERSLLRKPRAATLPHALIMRIYEAAVSSHLPKSRAALLGGVDPSFVEGMPLCANETGQILSDLHYLNASFRPGDDETPLRVWLENAAALAREGSEADVFRRALCATGAGEVERPVGAPRESDEITDELMRIGRAALLARDGELNRCLYEVDALLARRPNHVEAQMLRDRIKRAVDLAATRWLRAPMKSSSVMMSSSSGLNSEIPTRVQHTSVKLIGRTKEFSALTNEFGQTGALICGLGGIGKRALAREVFRALAPRYPDLQIGINLQGTSQAPLLPAAAMARVIYAFLPGVPPPSDPAEIAHLYRACLEGQRALLLLEDAADRAQVEPLLPPDGSALLITSRRRLALANVIELSLNPLDDPDAIALLQDQAPTITETAARRVSTACGGVPLALHLAGCALRNRPDLTPEAYLDRLLEAQAQHELLDAAFDVSVRLLDPILQIAWSGLGPLASTFGIYAALRTSNELSSFEDVSCLVNYGLVEYDPHTRLYNLPRSGRRLAISRLSEAEYAAIVRQETDRSKASRSKYGLGFWDPEAERAWLGLAGALSSARRVGHRPAEALYLESMANRHGIQPSAFEFAYQALPLYSELGDQPGASRMLAMLSAICEKSGNDRDAVEFGERAIVILRRLGDRLAESDMLETLCRLHERLMNTRRAIELHTRALAVNRMLGRRDLEWPTLETLARLYEHVNEDRRAVELREECFTIARGWGSKRDQAKIAKQISASYRRLGEMSKAITALQICVDLTRALDRSEAASIEAELEALRCSQADEPQT